MRSLATAMPMPGAAPARPTVRLVRYPDPQIRGSLGAQGPKTAKRWSCRPGGPLPGALFFRKNHTIGGTRRSPFVGLPELRDVGHRDADDPEVLRHGVVQVAAPDRARGSSRPHGRGGWRGARRRCRRRPGSPPGARSRVCPGMGTSFGRTRVGAVGKRRRFLQRNGRAYLGSRPSGPHLGLVWKRGHLMDAGASRPLPLIRFALPPRWPRRIANRNQAPRDRCLVLGTGSGDPVIPSTIRRGMTGLGGMERRSMSPWIGPLKRQAKPTSRVAGDAYSLPPRIAREGSARRIGGNRTGCATMSVRFRSIIHVRIGRNSALEDRGHLKRLARCGCIHALYHLYEAERERPSRLP